MTDRPALLLDLDGTLTDSVYQHALAWHKALELSGIKLSVWRIHRRIGMSGGLLAESLARETGRELSEKEAAKMKTAHARLFAAQLRAHVPQLRREETRVCRFHLRRFLLTQLAPGLARQAFRQQATAHADPPVNSPHRELDATQLQRLVPRQGVLVHAVGERAVEVEQQRGAVGHGAKLTP